MLLCDHYLSPDRYNPIVEAYLQETGFYHVFQIGVVQCQSAMVNALIERWCPETHTFHFSIGECAVSLEDVAMILGLPTNGVPVTGPTMSSFEAMEAECLHQFGVAPRNRDCRGSFIKLTWFRGLKDRTVLTDDIQIQRYVKCHIMLLFGTILFGDKSGAAVHWKFLPLLRDFAGIIQYSWGSACLAHLNRSLCRATRVNCKEIDGPLTLLLTWAWTRLPFLAPIPGNPRVFPIANRWRNWDRENFAYRYHTLAHYRRLLDDLQEGHAYGIDFIEPDVVPLDIRQHSVVWSATVPLISFECIEWHSSNRFKRQFGLIQDVPTQEWDLGTSHGEVLTGPKNQDWSNTHSFWIMQWTNWYSHVLADDLVPLHYPLEIYMHWYRGAFGAHLQISDLVFQEDPEGPPVHNQEEHQQEPPAPPPPPPPVPQEVQCGMEYVPQTHPSDYFTQSVPLHQRILEWSTS
ncbi:serine/threonine-protein phosphatase 7 long form homolog [Arachis hypogaea]|uniref:serine/threonine-protein phosphatase 7 long form homolog n=1 Tax=Arachis hypogaea TaxID=3818 RepID=UPI003B2125D0